MGVRPIISAVAAMALGGNVSGAFNALDPVLAAGSRGVSRARGDMVRSTLIHDRGACGLEALAFARAIFRHRGLCRSVH
jgi:hypothetical protein